MTGIVAHIWDTQMDLPIENTEMVIQLLQLPKALNWIVQISKANLLMWVFKNSQNWISRTKKLTIMKVTER